MSTLKSEKKHVRRILQLYKGSREGKQQHIAVTLRQGKVLSIGGNSYRKSSKTQRNFGGVKCFNHAEVRALEKCKAIPDTLIVIRVNKKGELMPSEPCPICKQVIGIINPRMKVIHS